MGSTKVSIMNRMFGKKDCTIVLCGEAGMGIQTVEVLLTRVLKRSGYHVFSTKEYMSRVRGGMNSTEVRVSGHPVDAYIDEIDIVVPLSIGALDHLAGRITSDTIILSEHGDQYSSESPNLILDAPFTTIAEEIGGKVYTNMVAAGVIIGILRADLYILRDFVTARFEAKGSEIVENNLTAVTKGFDIGRSFLDQHPFPFHLEQDPSIADHILVKGSESVALGAIAGGCSFISSYPMSPATGVLVTLASLASEFGIIAEQAEDEIAAINMALGAWYAGARAMVTTSGGGFALMAEGISLAGMIESPIVVHLAQRPGPATGLPTRTEQGDLELALYSGHGEFQRIIYAPGSLQEAFLLTQRAFDQADKHQIPVFVLTDQYLMDTEYSIPDLDPSHASPGHIEKTKSGYQRYKFTNTGVSPRGVPGFGDGLVCVDSDEHDQEGHITEDLDLRAQMVDKRLRKLDGILEDSIPPEFHGNKDFTTLLIAWGSTRNQVIEAMEVLDEEELGFIHFSQVHPIHSSIKTYLKQANRVILIEGNATGQFGKLILLATGIELKEHLLRFDGKPFASDELARALEVILDQDPDDGGGVE